MSLSLGERILVLRIGAVLFAAMSWGVMSMLKSIAIIAFYSNI
jgi:hypothetical protein